MSQLVQQVTCRIKPEQFDKQEKRRREFFADDYKTRQILSSRHVSVARDAEPLRPPHDGDKDPQRRLNNYVIDDGIL